MNIVSYNKMSKKQQKSIDNKKRNTWGNVCPVTKVAKDKTKYSRKLKHKGRNIYELHG